MNEANCKVGPGFNRVGVLFNPTANKDIYDIKTMAAELIDKINRIETDDGEIARLKALAMTAIEEGAMWGVKAVARSSG